MNTEKQDLSQQPPSYEQSTSGYPQPSGYQPVPTTNVYPPGQLAGYQPVPTTNVYPPGQASGYQPAPQGYPASPNSTQSPYGPPGQPQYVAQGQPHTTQQVIVVQPGQAGVIVTQPRPPDYMIPSVLACLCCFCPTGLCAIYYASQASKLAAEGDMTEALRMSNNARNLMITSVVLGIAWIVLVNVLRVVLYSSRTYSYGY